MIFCYRMSAAFILSRLVSSVSSYVIGWKERLRNDLFLSPLRRKTFSQSISSFAVIIKLKFALRGSSCVGQRWAGALLVTWDNAVGLAGIQS